MIGQTINQYHITEKLGAGGMGEVYLAEDTRLKRKVALKFLPRHFSRDPEVRSRFQREAQALAALNHPNIVTVFDVSEHEGQPYIAMEYVEGQSLKELIKSGDVQVDRAIEIASQIADGLAAAHEEKIVHRDIKSDNVILTSKGRVKIMDFGLATWRGVAQLTKEGSTVGTVAYMSPEQSQGREIDHRTDLWSLGVILYELITGHLPFAGDHEAAITYAIASEPAQPLARYRSDCPAGLQEIVERALEKDSETRYQSAAGMRADLKRFQRTSDSRVSVVTPPSTSPSQPTVPSTAKSGSGIGLAISASVLAVIALVLLILRPWEVEIQPRNDAAAVENRLAVMYFDNVAEPGDPQRLGEIATNLLITDLSGSQHVQVVSSQRLYDILKLLGHEGEKTISPDIATQVAQKAGARWMMMGSILKSEPNMVVTAQIVDVESGNTVASQRITGKPGEDIFPLVDQLTVDVKKGLSIPSDLDEDKPVAVATTTSRDAYRNYLEGLELFERYKLEEAAQKFKDVIAIDSSFAMAYYSLAMTSVRLQSRAVARRYLDRAITLSDQLSHKDRLYVNALDVALKGKAQEALSRYQAITEEYPDDKTAWYTLSTIQAYWLNDYDAAIKSAEEAIEVDPMYKLPYNTLAYLYSHIREFEKSIWAINKYIELAPNEPNPYDSRGELYGYGGQLDEAIASFQKALEIDPEFYASRIQMANMYVVQGRYTEADSLFSLELSSESSERRADGRLSKAGILIAQGRLRDAIEYLQKSAGADELDGEMDNAGGKLNRIAVLFEELGDTARALAVLRDNYSKADSTTGWEFLIPKFLEMRMLAEQGELGRADSSFATIEPLTHSPEPLRRTWTLLAKAVLESYKGHHASALQLANDTRSASTDFGRDYYKGIIYLRAGELGQAASHYEFVINHFNRSRAALMDCSVLLHYYLGVTYEESGWNSKAIAQYEEFIDLWGNGDPEIVKVKEARERLARLKGQS